MTRVILPILGFLVGCASAPVGFLQTKYPVAWPNNPYFQLGSRFYAPNDSEKHTSILMLHGSEGGAAMQLDGEANVLATQGFNVLLYCYFDCQRNSSGVQPTLKNVSIARLQEAIAWLRARPESNGKVVIYGFSRGAELALILGSLPTVPTQTANAIIAHSPSDIYNTLWNPGWSSRICQICRRGPGKCPKFWMREDFSWDSRCGPDDPDQTDFTLSPWIVEQKAVNFRTRIAVEKFSGPILMTVGEKDDVWPAEQTHRLEDTLKRFGHTPDVYYFKDAGHSFRGPDELKRRQLVLDFLHHVPSSTY